jgi:hypothetical protein
MGADGTHNEIKRRVHCDEKEKKAQVSIWRLYNFGRLTHVDTYIMNKGGKFS